MGYISKSYGLILIAAVLSLTILVAMPLGLAQNGTSERGIISSDTTWSKTGSPYNLIGPVVVNQGVTLTIEPGVTINLNNYYLQVNGALRAIGTGADKICINGPTQAASAKINFTTTSPSWNEQNNGGSILQECVLNATSIDISGTSPKISNNFLSAYYAPDVIFLKNASPQIINNTIVTVYTTVGIAVVGGSPIISNNYIHSANYRDTWGVEINGDNKALIYGNIISDYQTGIKLDNGNPTIQRNMITNNGQGININSRSPPPTLVFENNTVSHNNCAIIVGELTDLSVIRNNNFESNEQLAKMSDYLPSNTITTIKAINNWWGTADSPAVNKTINTGLFSGGGIIPGGPFFVAAYVEVIPVLSSPNPQAEPDLNNFPASIQVSNVFPANTVEPTQPAGASSSTLPSNPSSSQTSTSSQPSSEPEVGINAFESLIIVGIAIIIALLVAILVIVLKKQRQN